MREHSQNHLKIVKQRYFIVFPREYFNKLKWVKFLCANKIRFELIQLRRKENSSFKVSKMALTSRYTPLNLKEPLRLFMNRDPRWVRFVIERLVNTAGGISVYVLPKLQHPFKIYIKTTTAIDTNTHWSN